MPIGFVTFKTIAEAHRIARTHQGLLRELYGAQLALAPTPHDIVWENIPKEPAEIVSRRTFGFVTIAVVCFLNTLPVRVLPYGCCNYITPFIVTGRFSLGQFEHFDGMGRILGKLER